MEKELDELMARVANWQDKLEEQSVKNNDDDGDDEWLNLCREICDKADDENKRWSEDDEEDDEDALLFADYDIDVEEMEGDEDDDDYDNVADVDDDGWLD